MPDCPASGPPDPEVILNAIREGVRHERDHLIVKTATGEEPRWLDLVSPQTTACTTDRAPQAWALSSSSGRVSPHALSKNTFDLLAIWSTRDGARFIAGGITYELRAEVVDGVACARATTT